jgi:hypothetical protein
MEGTAVSPVALLAEIIKEHAPEDIWQGSPLLGYRHLGNTNRGEIGEEFIRRYLNAAHIDVGAKGNRAALTDMLIGGHHFEIKTASLGANSTFQFNHIRMDRKYECLLCLGICPQEIVFNAWRKGDVAEDKAGHLVRMAEGQSVTYKLTKKLSDMKPISALQQFLLDDWSIKPA